MLIAVCSVIMSNSMSPPTLPRRDLLECRASLTQMCGNSSPKIPSFEVSSTLDISLLPAKSTANQRLFARVGRNSRVVACASRLGNKQIHPHCTQWKSQPLLMMRVVSCSSVTLSLTPIHPSDLAIDTLCARNVRRCPRVVDLDPALLPCTHKTLQVLPLW